LRVGIVGAGPAGAMLGHELARRGLPATIFDDSHPREKPCGGGLTGRALALLPEAPEDDPLPARDVAECRIEGPGRPGARVALPRAIAVAARADLDAWLLRRAIAAGVRHVPERVTQLPARGVVRTGTGRTESYDVIVGADGAGSLVRRTFLSPTPPERLAQALGWYAPGTSPMLVRLLPEISGYLWLFPRPDHVGVGVCAPLGRLPGRALMERLERDVARLYPALAPAPDSGRYAATIPSPSSDPASLREIAGDGWALVGDAAALADPLTGEGIHSALRSAQILAEALAAGGTTAAYAARVADELGEELTRAARIRDRFFAESFVDRLLDLAARSRTIRRILASLVVGDQGYVTLKRRLLLAAPRVGVEWLVSHLRGI
jgi:flavin-dependent dehydrogenase